MIKNIIPADCCGCSACASICTHNAITMRPDVLGFLYPEVDMDKCVDCGLCDKVCAFNKDYDKSMNLPEPIAYAARHKDMSEVETSRSGAAFIAISDWVLEKGGVIYGAGYTGHFKVTHKRATTKKERDEFKGSKYVQSDMNTIFRQIKKDLIEDRFVLFSGTPCQTAGLNSYIGKRLKDRLYLVDIVCHGVPSPSFWDDYLSYIEKKEKDTVDTVNFRDKNYGWRQHYETYKFRQGRLVTKMTFKHLFYKHIMLRHSCGNCHYANIYRPSDITIADFWGWEKTNSEINKDDKGVNLILINTQKGNEIFNAIKNNLIVIPAKLKDALQPNLCHPSEIHPDRMNFEEDYIKQGFEYTMKKYCDIGMKQQLQHKLQIIKRLIKK